MSCSEIYPELFEYLESFYSIGHRATSEVHEIEAQKFPKSLLQFSAGLATTYLTMNPAANCSWGGWEILNDALGTRKL